MNRGTEYQVRFRGATYTVALRTCPDEQHVPAYVFAAAQAFLVGMHSPTITLPDDFFVDEIRLNQLLNLVTVEGARRAIVVPDKSGQDRLVPLPWESWGELSRDDLKAVLSGFFAFWRTKTSPFVPSENSMKAGDDLRRVWFASEVWTRNFITPDASPDGTFATPTESSGDIAGTTSEGSPS